MRTSLTLCNFLSNYIFSPCSKALSKQDKWIALLASVALGFTTFGVLHLALYLQRKAVRKLTSAKMQGSPDTKKANEVARSKFNFPIPLGEISILNATRASVIGNDFNLLPETLQKIESPSGEEDWKKHPEEFVFEVRFYSFHLINGGLPWEFYLPARFFDGKANGDIISFIWNKQHYHCKINQQQTSPSVEKGDLKEIFLRGRTIAYQTYEGISQFSNWNLEGKPIGDATLYNDPWTKREQEAKVKRSIDAVSKAEEMKNFRLKRDSTCSFKLAYTNRPAIGSLSVKNTEILTYDRWWKKNGEPIIEVELPGRNADDINILIGDHIVAILGKEHEWGKKTSLNGLLILELEKILPHFTQVTQEMGLLLLRLKNEQGDTINIKIIL